MTRTTRAGLSIVSLAIVTVLGPWLFGGVAAQGSGQGAGVPRFEADPTWPKLPNNWILGEVSSVAVDRRDHVWVLHRPRTVPAEQKDKAAPALLEFDASGKFVQSIGGPGTGYDWPDNEHAITVDYKDNVWIGGNNPSVGATTKRSDDMLLKFTNKGKFLKQIGGWDRSGGNTDTTSVKRAADVFVYRKTNEAFVADGYGNRRVLVLDAGTMAFKRMWGAFSNTPQEAPPAGSPAPERVYEGPGSQQFGIVHGLEVSNDGLVYVADRGNSRIQVFTLEGKYITQGFVNRRGAAGANTVAGLAFSPDAQQQFIYAADQSNSMIHILRRKTLEVIDSIGTRSPKPGDFQGLHHIASDSKGNLYTAEAQVGRRAQKLVFKGLSPKSTQ
jgi:hypothetical protein